MPVGRRVFPLFESGGTEVNRALERIARDDWQYSRMHKGRPKKGAQRPRSRHRTPSRIELVERLDAEGLLPAITFVFSRAGCAAAVQQCLDARLSLTTCLLYTSPSPRDRTRSRMPSSA